MTNDLTPHTSSQSSQMPGNGADAQPLQASPSDLAWLTRAGTGFERYVLLEAAGARVCTAAAFAHTARVRFEMGVPRAYGFIQPKWEVHGDGAVGDDRVLSFDMAWDGYVNGVDCYHCEVNIADILNGAQDGLFFYHYVLCDGVYYVRDALGYFTRREETYLHRLLVYADGTSLPKWVGDGFIYQIFVDRFCDSGRKKPCKPGARLHREWEGGTPEFAARRGDPIDNRDFFGGDLWGVCDKLDELKAMGVGTLYLSPVFDAASNHKYDTGDYEHVDVMFGGDAALIALFEQAHARGMHVILDGVFNHTGSDSRYFNRYGTYPTLGAYQSLDSPYAAWYHFRHFPNDYECWWGIDILPRLRVDEPSCHAYLCQVVKKWTRAGADGWRLDVADELSDGFLESLRMSLKKTNPDAMLYGEVWENAADKMAYGKRRKYLRGQQLDSVMNYPLRAAIIGYLRDGDADAMRRVCTDIYGSYPPFAVQGLMNFLGTHDTPRILSVLGDPSWEHCTRGELAQRRLSNEAHTYAKKLLKLAFLILFGMPGVPCVFYGDEVGMEGYDDPFNRRPYPWHNRDMELLKYVTTLGTFRKSEPLLQRGQLRLLYADATCLVFARYDDTRAVLFYINRGEKRCTVRLTTADGATDTCTLSPLSGLYRTADTTAVDGTIEVLRVDLPTD